MPMTDSDKPTMQVRQETLARLCAIVGEAGLVREESEREQYLREWRGRYQGTTPLIVKPRTTREVAEVVAICAEAGLGVVPQGGNTGLVGGQIPGLEGTQILLLLSRMNRIRALDPIDDTITVEAGCTLAAVQEAALRVDRLFPLSLAAEGTCQIGGNLSTNAGGVHVLRYGNARALVLGLEVVLADGRIWDGLRTLRKDNTGYDLKQLFIGAEGTLGIITAASLRLFPRHRAITTVFAAVPSPASAVQLLAALRARTCDAILAFELLPRFGLELVLRHIPGTREPLPGTASWYVLCDLLLAAAEAEAALDDASKLGLLGEAVVAANPAQAAALWRLRESLSEAQKPEGASLKHDIAVSVSRIPAFLDEALAAVERAVPGVRPVPFGHVGDGNLHFNLTRPLNMTDAEFVARREEVARLVHDIVAAHGGSISAEHGIGFMKRDEIRRYKSDVELDLMRRIKLALDPKNILNPGKGSGYL